MQQGPHCTTICVACCRLYCCPRTAACKLHSLTEKFYQFRNQAAVAVQIELQSMYSPRFIFLMMTWQPEQPWPAATLFGGWAMQLRMIQQVHHSYRHAAIHPIRICGWLSKQLELPAGPLQEHASNPALALPEDKLDTPISANAQSRLVHCWMLSQIGS